MTGGVVVILGSVGPNFAAGMSGGMAFVYDVDDRLPERINPDSVIHQRIETDYWEGQVHDLITEHWRATQSAFAQQIRSEARRVGKECVSTCRSRGSQYL